MSTKPLGRKAYGSIGHLPHSRLGPGDHSVHEGQARICLERARDRRDHIVVQEKLDGGCVAVARLGDTIMPLIRAGYPATSSPRENFQFFAAWVRAHETRFRAVLNDGERLCGEWLLQAAGTRYNLPHEPFVVFDLMVEARRVCTVDALRGRVQPGGFMTPRLLHAGSPVSVNAITSRLEPSGHGATDPVEGAVWRVERDGETDFLAKWVRHDKVDGKYFPEIDPVQFPEPVWNQWRAPSGQWHPTPHTIAEPYGVEGVAHAG